MQIGGIDLRCTVQRTKNFSGTFLRPTSSIRVRDDTGIHSYIPFHHDIHSAVPAGLVRDARAFSTQQCEVTLVATLVVTRRRLHRNPAPRADTDVAEEQTRRMDGEEAGARGARLAEHGV